VLYVSTGNVLVPNVVGKSQDDAESALTKAKLGVVVETVESDKPEGTVISQTPDAKVLVRQGAKVTIQVAQAPQQITVPKDLVGLTYDQAVARLADVGLTNVKKVVEPSSAPLDQVLYTNPNGGQQVDPGTLIEIHVSDGSASGAPAGGDPTGGPTGG